MATILNPNAPLFFPAASSDEPSLIFPPFRPSPPQPFPPFISHHNCITKNAIFFHPPLFYFNTPSLYPHFTTNFSYYIPQPKHSFSLPTIIESEAAEGSGAFPRLGDELGGVEEQRLSTKLQTRVFAAGWKKCSSLSSCAEHPIWLAMKLHTC